jgi:Fibronectin type III domain
VGKLRAQLDRVIGARGSWGVCSLLLASTLLSGCHGTSAASSASDSAAAATSGASAEVAQPLSSNATPPSPSTYKSVDVTWTAPTTNTNGSALTNLAGYRVYYGTSSGALNQSVDVPNAGATDYVVQDLTAGTWYFAVAAYTNTGLQSSYSSVVSKTIT